MNEIIYNIQSTIERKTNVLKPIAKVLLLVLTAIGNQVKAENKTLVNGFISQGYIITDDNNVNGNSESGTFKLTEVGLNASKRISPRLRIASQIITRRVNAKSDGDINIDYAFIDYKAPINQNNQWGARLGRVKNALGLYNETQDVAFTRPSIYAPKAIYFDFARDLQLSSDGILFNFENRSNIGTTLFETGYGKARANRETEELLLGNNTDGKFTGETMFQSRLSLTSNDERWKIAYSRLDVGLDFRQAPSSPFPNGDIAIDLNLLSAEYNARNWVFSAEYLRMNYKVRFPALFQFSLPIESWYLQSQYYVDPNWSFYSRYENYFPDKNDKNGQRLNAVTGRPAFFGFQKSLLAGVKWQPNKSWMLMLELQNNRGVALLNTNFGLDSSDTEKNWQMLSVMLSYRF